MPDQDPHPPYEDELLSAYLDDELSPEERARVEQRLATDPAARQWLDQLRAVSRAVQDLPRETVGEDLREAILLRAKLATAETEDMVSAQAAPEPMSDELEWPMPKFSAGRTMRGWVWAGLAIAAALVIMVLQPGSHKEADLPGTVAMRSDQGSVRPERTLELRSRNEESPTEAETVVDSSDRVGGGGLGGAAAESAAPPVTPPLTVGTPLATTNTPEGGFESRRRSMAEDQIARSASASQRDSISSAVGREELADQSSPTPAEPPTNAAADQLVVVHVQVTPVAFQNKAFDSLLARNGITVEEAAANDNRSAPVAGEMASREELAPLKDEKPSPALAPELDVVLVDAPAAQVASCLADLDQDTHNYLAVDIDEEPPASKPLAVKNAPVDEWKQFNRGTVPPQQKMMALSRAQGAARGGSYYAEDADAYRSTAESNLTQLRQKVGSYDNRGRAMRVQVENQAPDRSSLGYRFSGIDSLSSGPAAAKSETGGIQPKPSPEGLTRKLAKNTENVQVLFFLCPDGPPTPSLETGNQAK